MSTSKPSRVRRLLDKINGKHDEPTQAHASAGRSPDPNPPTRPVPATAAAPAAATTNPKGGGDVKTSTTTEGSHPSEQDKKGWLKPLLITLALLVVAVLVIAGCRQLTPSGNNEPSGTAGQTTSESSPSASPTPNSPEETEQSDNAQTDTESETTEGEQADTETNSEPATHNSNAPPASSVQQSPASAGLPADVWTDDINWIWADSVESGLNVFSHANPKSPQELAAAIAASPAVLQAIPGWTGENVRFYQANSNVVWNQGRGMASIDEWGNITWGTDFVDPAGVVIAIDSAGNVLRIKCLNAGDGAPVATTAPATFPRLYEVKEPKAEQPAIGGPVGPKPTKPETVTVVEKPEKPNPTQPHKPEVPSKPEKPGEGGPEGPKPEEPHKPEEPEVPEEKLVKVCLNKETGEIGKVPENEAGNYPAIEDCKKEETPEEPEKPGEGGPEGPKPEEPHKPEEPEVPEEKLVKVCLNKETGEIGKVPENEAGNYPAIEDCKKEETPEEPEKPGEPTCPPNSSKPECNPKDGDDDRIKDEGINPAPTPGTDLHPDYKPEESIEEIPVLTRPADPAVQPGSNVGVGETEADTAIGSDHGANPADPVMDVGNGNVDTDRGQIDRDTQVNDPAYGGNTAVNDVVDPNTGVVIVEAGQQQNGNVEAPANQHIADPTGSPNDWANQPITVPPATTQPVEPIQYEGLQPGADNGLPVATIEAPAAPAAEAIVPVAAPQAEATVPAPEAETVGTTPVPVAEDVMPTADQLTLAG